MIANTSARLLDVAQAARALHVSTDTVRRRIRDGSLPALRVGTSGNLRIREDSIERLLVPYHPNDERTT